MRIVISATHRNAVLLCAAILALSSCARTNTAGAGAASAGAPPLVPVTKAARADLASDVVLTAEFQPFQQVDVMAKMAGYVRSINVDLGDRVRAGQVLATLEIPEMEDDLVRAAAAIGQADAEVATASDELRRDEAAHDLAHLSYGRIADVLRREPGLVPQQEVDEARSRDLVAEAQAASAKSSVRTAEQRTRVARAEQTRIQTLHNYMTIAAPFDGVVTKRYANAGSMIQAGTASQTQAMPLVQLSQNNLLRLILPVPESAVSRVHVGGSVQVRVSSLNRAFQGRVARFAGDIQPSTRTMDAEVDVPNPTLTLIPGMYAEVNLRVDEHRDALSVPLDAVDRNGPSARVYTVTSAGVIRIVPVTLGLEDDKLVEVRSGLREGDVVVVGRRTGLKDGQPVEIKLLSAQVH
jgi:RND family efflux transporter MFP subunit